MKISANIHAVKITLSGITDTVTVADSNRTVNFNKPAGRFDTFSLVSTGKYDKESKLSLGKSELIRNSEGMS